MLPGRIGCSGRSGRRGPAVFQFFSNLEGREGGGRGSIVGLFGDDFRSVCNISKKMKKKTEGKKVFEPTKFFFQKKIDKSLKRNNSADRERERLERKERKMLVSLKKSQNPTV